VRSLLLALGAIGLLALVVSACGQSGTPGAASSLLPTSTTLPIIAGVTGSATTGSFSTFGAVDRVAVLPVKPGRVAPRLWRGGMLGSGSVRIAFRSFGSGPNLLLITGEHGSMTSWDPQVLLELAAYYRVTVFDLPGIGYSAPSTRPVTVPYLADLTAGLIWSLGLSQPTVVGWGFGGEIAMSLVERHPGLVWRLVLADATPGGPESRRPGTGAANMLSSSSATRVELSRLFFPPGADSARLSWLADVAEVNPDDITAPAIDQQGTLVSESYRSDTVARGLGAIGIPTLIFAGSDDEVVPVVNSRQLARWIVHSRLVIFSGAGYAAIFQYGSDFVTELTAFTGV
jgi:pimeloyl-ACP methyl ester carboxylesterase